jgi:hypothetical protein
MITKEYTNTRDYLRSAIWLNNEINENRRRISELKAKVRGTSIRYKADKIQTSGSKDIIGDIIAEYTALEKETDDLIDEYVDLKEKLRKEISLCDKECWVKVLVSMYIHGKTIYETADILNKPDGTVKMWHREAIINFFEKNKHNMLYIA